MEVLSTTLAMTNLSVYNFIMKNIVTVCFDSEMQAAIATQFANKNELTIKDIVNASTPFVLHYKNNFVELIDQQEQTRIHVDFITGTLAHRRKYGGGKGQAIAKAIGIKNYKLPLTILDITAGLAKDAFVLACLGCSVTMIERHPIIAELVKNALFHAKTDESFQIIKQQGFNLIKADALHYLKNISNKRSTIKPDVIYMDPMYPERKKSASVKKSMQMLQKLICFDSNKVSDETSLLTQALMVAQKRVVVKRPKGAPTLTDKAPTMCIESKITRYDVYVLT